MQRKNNSGDISTSKMKYALKLLGLGDGDVQYEGVTGYKLANVSPTFKAYLAELESPTSAPPAGTMRIPANLAREIYEEVTRVFGDDSPQVAIMQSKNNSGSIATSKMKYALQLLGLGDGHVQYEGTDGYTVAADVHPAFKTHLARLLSST